MPQLDAAPPVPAAVPPLSHPEPARSETEVYAIHGADPEVLAYAMARYSRSALSLRESLRQISSERAEQFLNTFYFQYGHRSIADLAHLAFAIERLSLLAAIVLVDEQRWDGQERSTRYQNFQKSGWHLPPALGGHREQEQLYIHTVEDLFTHYHQVAGGVFASLKRKTERPAGMKEDAFDRTLRARAFDVARYLLPLATNTSLGQIVNARTLETQVSRLLSDPHAEVRNLGERLRAAASGSAWNVQGEENAELLAELRGLHPDLASRAEPLLVREVKVAPTLVKYAARNSYQTETARDLADAAASLMGNTPIAPAPAVPLPAVDLPAVGLPAVDLVEKTETLEAELAATLLYRASHYPFRQLRDHVAALPAARQNEIIDLGIRHRGRHDELLREFSAGQALRFDILMDIGGFRDMHRHRRCTQILQGFTALHGWEVPEGLAEAGLGEDYDRTMETAHHAFRTLAASAIPEGEATARYLLPLGTRCRSLFKMDFAQALYIAELRSAPQGHFSYRRIAWEMYKAVERQYPALARHFRVADIHEPVDILKR